MRSVLSALVLAVGARAATYGVSDTWIGSAFYSAFTFQAIADPTNGRVNYVNQQTAQAQNLTFASSDTFILRADHTTTLSASGAGRNSVRIQSVKTYSTHVLVADMRHMPQGCSTWPALWEVGPNWPNGGEVDIVEGVNDVAPNQSTLHTSAGCTMPGGLAQTGNQVSTDCNANDNGNAGCGSQVNKANSYGPGFNNAGGGYYAMERTPNFVKVWFWTRNGGGAPSDVVNGASSVDTDNWGTPYALFPNTQCNIASHFAAANVIINLTLCGDWAGAVFTQDGCGADCVSFVNSNPSAFSNAYFDFKAIRVYQ